jgi:hypothetical protein
MPYQQIVVVCGFNLSVLYFILSLWSELNYNAKENKEEE